jgi:type I restriction enzyme S subunit
LGDVAEFNPKAELPEIFEYVDLESVVGTEMIAHRKVRKEKAPSRAQRLARQGDLFYQTVRPYQKNNYLFEKPCNNYVFSTGYAQLRPYGDGYFLLSLVQTEQFVKAVLDRCTGTSYPAINSNDLANMEVYVPSRGDEQIQIGRLFKSVDHLITLYQQKLDKLKELKKGYLDQMFTQKIRFKGFDGEWETLKSDEIFFSISEKNYPKLPVLSATQEKGMIYRDDIGIDIKYDEKNKKTFKRVLPGQFVIHLRSFQGGFAYSEIEGITSPAYTILDFISRKSHYPLFWKYVLTSNSFIKRLESVTYGIRDGRSISFSDFSTLKFQVPSYQEQKAIGDFLVQLEDTIILQELKLSKLNELKKAFLQKMFI